MRGGMDRCSLLSDVHAMREAGLVNTRKTVANEIRFARSQIEPHMRRTGGGAILNTGSIGSFTGQLNTPAYIASKGAVALFTKSLALDYGRAGIRVNCICPGITDTPMLHRHMGYGEQGEQNIRKRLARVPLGKILEPADVARAALYLVSDDSAGITGITHVIDGGLLAAAEYDVPLEEE